MILEWDEVKNRANIRKHGLDFADAEEMFQGILVADPDTREDYGERRWIGLGMLRGSHDACGLRGTRTGHYSHHLIEKGNSS